MTKFKHWTHIQHLNVWKENKLLDKSDNWTSQFPHGSNFVLFPLPIDVVTILHKMYYKNTTVSWILANMQIHVLQQQHSWLTHGLSYAVISYNDCLNFPCAELSVVSIMTIRVLLQFPATNQCMNINNCGKYLFSKNGYHGSYTMHNNFHKLHITAQLK